MGDVRVLRLGVKLDAGPGTLVLEYEKSSKKRHKRIPVRQARESKDTSAISLDLVKAHRDFLNFVPYDQLKRFVQKIVDHRHGGGADKENKKEAKAEGDETGKLAVEPIDPPAPQTAQGGMLGNLPPLQPLGKGGMQPTVSSPLKEVTSAKTPPAKDDDGDGDGDGDDISTDYESDFSDISDDIDAEPDETSLPAQPLGASIDLNKVSEEELARQKQLMNKDFEKNLKKPDDPDYVYDKKVDFSLLSGSGACSWDESGVDSGLDDQDDDEYEYD